jgi:uncharacterized protein
MSEVKEFLWRTWDANSLEHVRLSVNPDTGSIQAEGILIGVNEEKPYTSFYEIEFTPDFMVRAFNVGERPMMSHDGNGHWHDDINSFKRQEFDGCTDIDITATPFTNALAIRRLGLKPGESADIKVVYVDVFKRRLNLRGHSHYLYPAAQRYTCITPHLYRFEMPSIDFTAEIPVDDDGFVLDYPELFQRLYPRPKDRLREAPLHNIVS